MSDTIQRLIQVVLCRRTPFITVVRRLKLNAEFTASPKDVMRVKSQYSPWYVKSKSFLSVHDYYTLINVDREAKILEAPPASVYAVTMPESKKPDHQRAITVEDDTKNAELRKVGSYSLRLQKQTTPSRTSNTCVSMFNQQGRAQQPIAKYTNIVSLKLLGARINPRIL